MTHIDFDIRLGKRGLVNQEGEHKAVAACPFASTSQRRIKRRCEEYDDRVHEKAKVAR